MNNQPTRMCKPLHHNDKIHYIALSYRIRPRIHLVCNEFAKPVAFLLISFHCRSCFSPILSIEHYSSSHSPQPLCSSLQPASGPPHVLLCHLPLCLFILHEMEPYLFPTVWASFGRTPQSERSARVFVIAATHTAA